MADTVADLLGQSRAAHAQYRILHAQTQNHALPAMGEAIRTALRARAEAEALDPHMTDAAWVQDTAALRGVTHAILMDFYTKYLADTRGYA